MESIRFLSTSIHGILDYIFGIFLLLVPTIFGFASIGGPAVIIPYVLGVVLIIYSLFTNYELGLVKVLPMPYHLVIDFLAAVFLALSPFLFGFSDQAISVWYPHLIGGIVVILVVLVSQTHPRNSNF